MKSAASMPSAGALATTAPGWLPADGAAGRPAGQPARGGWARARATRPVVAHTTPGGADLVRFALGQRIFGPGSGAGMVYIVRAGCIRLYKTLPNRRTINLGLIGPNMVFTQEDADDGLASGLAAEALLDSTLLIVGADDLQAVIAQSPELAAPLVRGLTRRLTDVQTVVAHLLARDVSLRLAATLLALAEAVGVPGDDGMTTIAVPVSRRGLADMIGANRVTVTRRLLAMERAGLVQTLGRTTIAVDREGLRRRATTRREPASGIARRATEDAACTHGKDGPRE